MPWAALRAVLPMLLCGSLQAQILIGQTTGLSGNSAANVRETTAGARLWIDAVNARGGVEGQPIEVIALDDKGDARLAEQNARTLIQQRKVLALFMVRGTPQNAAILPLLEQHEVPSIAPSTGAMLLHEPVRRYVFNVRSPYQDEAQKVVRQLSSMGVSRIAVLKTRDAFGDDAAQGAARGFTQSGRTPVLVEAFDKAQPDFAPLVPRLVAAEVQAVLVIGSGAAVAQATLALRAAGSRAMVVTLSNNASAGFVALLGPHARGVVVTQVFPDERSLAVPMIKEANDLLKAQGGGTLSPAVVEGFAAAKVLVEALRRAGAHPTRASLQRALESMATFDLGGLALHFGPGDHSGLHFTDLSIIDAEGHFRR
jgi:ABC-type branched-subunit amino acid transport system substrate-binding protein